MLFLVDYENVGAEGMRGCELLSREDWLILFYSAASSHMEKRYLEQIERSGCQFDIVKLVKIGKNGLDFYMASHLGKIYGKGFRSKTIIISRDSGFMAVRDYWTKCEKANYQVYLSSNIEKGVYTAAPEKESIKKLKELMKSVDIKEFYSGYQERTGIRRALAERFGGTEYIEKIAEIQQILERSKNSRKGLYLECLKMFGRDRGLFVYHTLKNGKFADIITNIITQASVTEID